MRRIVLRPEWRELLLGVLADTRQRAEDQLGHGLESDPPIEIAGYGLGGRTYTVDEAADAIYLGPTRFYRVIDVAVRFYPDGNVTYWIRPSGHPPSEWERTWESSGRGPLKVVGLMAPPKLWKRLTGYDPPGLVRD
jgi:hypothetical protein